MSVQVKITTDLRNFILDGDPYSRDQEIIAQDAGRTIPLAPFTVMSKVAATQKWVPFTNEAAIDGSALPQGIYIGYEIPADDLVAGDVEDLPIYIGNGLFDSDRLVIENAKTLDTIISAGTVEARTVRDELARRGIFFGDTVRIHESL